MQPSRWHDIQKPRLSREVAKRLARTIREGRLLPGERLPSERRLCHELGVSRPVLREALRSLAGQGYLEIRHGSGSFVLDAATQLANVEPVAWFAENHRRVRDFYDARVLLESETAARAAERARPTDLARLRTILSEADEVLAHGQVGAAIGLDIDFHRAIAELAGNAFLCEMLDAIIDTDTDIRRVLHRLPGRPEAAHQGHERILEAIASGEPDRAREVMAAALARALRDIERLVEGGDGHSHDGEVRASVARRSTRGVDGAHASREGKSA